ncbi:MAG: amidase [Chloroflexota bacterium]|nr:amidase [Chloroflexota bacterium]
MATDDYAYRSARDLIEGYRAREFSPVEVTDALLNRIDRINPAINAFTDITADLARDAARASEKRWQNEEAHALDGVPLTIKDIAFTAGVRTARGSRIYADSVPDFNSPFVDRVLNAGAIMLGKTTTPEFGWKGETTSPVSGTTRNPWNLDRTPGGSSGGASACVAAGLGPIAHGTDGAGSIRIPAGFAGVFGIKPTIGLVPVYPASAVGDLAHHGPLSWTVADAALTLDVTAGHDPRDRFSWTPDGSYLAALNNLDLAGLRIAWSKDLGYAAVENEVATVTAEAARVFADLGCEIVEAHPDLPDPWPIEHVIWSTAMAASRAHDLDAVREIMDPGLVRVIEEGQRFTGPEAAKARIDQGLYAAAWSDFMGDYDLLLTPTLPCTAFPVGQDQPGSVAGVETSYLSWTAFTYPFNLTGQPAATVPCGFGADGLPIGLQIVGRLRDDALVLRAAAAFEQARPWQGRVPAIG